MSLQELFDTVMRGESAARLRNTKTAVNVLAKALGYPTPTDCPPGAYAKPLPSLYSAVEQALAGKGPYTLRNTKNNLSYLFRKAADHGVTVLPPSVPERRFTIHDWLTKRPRRSDFDHDGSWLRFKDWPPPLRAEWDAFFAWATLPVVDNRPAQWRKRPATVESLYALVCQAFFGYVVHPRGCTLSDLRFAQMTDPTLIKDFIYWHINTRHHRVTTLAKLTVTFAKVLVTQYWPNPDAAAALLEFSRKLPKATPIYNKQDVWVGLETLEQVGQAIWPTRALPDILRSRANNGKGFAFHAGMSLMLRLLIRRPYRQRNIREMKVGEHLFKDTGGRWVIRFEGEQLKVSEKKGKRNVFELPFPDDLVPALEQYLSTWRPLLAVRYAVDPAYVFLNRRGTPFTYQILNWNIRFLVYQYTGKALHPHLIRSVWATEYIRRTGDFYSAAIMLNDRLETVVQNYSELLDHGVAEKTDQWMREITKGSTPGNSRVA